MRYNTNFVARSPDRHAENGEEERKAKSESDTH